MFFFFFNDTSTTEIFTYLHTLSLHDALPILVVEDCDEQSFFIFKGFINAAFRQLGGLAEFADRRGVVSALPKNDGCLVQDIVHIELARAPWCARDARSEEHTSELQSLMRISYAVFCLKKKKKINRNHN